MGVAVEVPAYPDRYAAYEPVAEAILDAMATGTASGSCGDSATGAGVPSPPGFAGALIAAAQTQLGKPTSGAEAHTPGRPALAQTDAVPASTAPAWSCTPRTRHPAESCVCRTARQRR